MQRSGKFGIKSFSKRSNLFGERVNVTFASFINEESINRMKEQIQQNYNQIKEDTKQIVTDELERIKDDPELAKLLQQK